MTLTLIFYQISEKFNDDERLISAFISEALQPSKIYKDLLNGKFDKYATLLSEITKNKSDAQIQKWCECKKRDLTFMCEDWANDDFKNIEGK